jgi:hypothetical protein
MVIESAMEAFFNAIVLALTPIQRWGATRRLDVNPDAARWLIMIAVVALVVLTILFFIVSYLRRLEWKRISKELFVEYANKRGLSEQERQILLRIAKAARLKQDGAIFTMSKTFDYEAAKMVEKNLARYGQEASSKLRMELLLLREKLGFKIISSASIGSTMKPAKMSSRRIPVGKNIYIRQLKGPELGEVKATIVKNDGMEFTIQFSDSIKSTVGETLRVHYYFGSTFWEFDTSVISVDGERWVLNHSDDVRFINRRAFPRVTVNRPAFIARFEFLNQLTINLESDDKKNSSKTEKLMCETPQFVPAVITELAGSGLRIETGLKVTPGNRVLVVFSLEEKKVQRLIAGTNRGEEISFEKSEPEQEQVKVMTAISKVAEDIGEVRDVKAIENGFSIGVELTGLTDFDLDELVRVTNIASIKSDAKDKRNEKTADGNELVRDSVTGATVVQGV